MFESAHEDATAEPWDNAASRGCDGKEHRVVTPQQTEFPQ